MIPMSKDVAELVGPNAAKVENRSLLYEKFALPKVYGHPWKVDDATKWNVFRIVTKGKDVLRGESTRLNKQSQGRNASQENKERFQALSKMAATMSDFAEPQKKLMEVQIANTVSLLDQVKVSYGGLGVAFKACLGGRLLINMAGGVVENAGICLDRCFGMPHIPGSAVKGITRAYALWQVYEARGDAKIRMAEAAMLIFGYSDNDWKVSGNKEGDFAWAAGKDVAQVIASRIQADKLRGHVCFLPAGPLSIPAVVADIVNSHYPDYYTGKRQKAEDNEGPRPNFFPAVEAGTEYGFAAVLMRKPCLEEWTPEALLRQLQDWMNGAIHDKGLGAKTGAGYGWFRLENEKPLAITCPAGTAGMAAPATCGLPPGLQAFTPDNMKTSGNFRVVVPQMNAIADDVELRKVFEFLIPHAERVRMRKGNPYWQSFTSGPHGEAGKAILRRLGMKLT
jgi:CRISPR type III-B/RAMP module RAMP protein Cmr6